MTGALQNMLGNFSVRIWRPHPAAVLLHNWTCYPAKVEQTEERELWENGFLKVSGDCGLNKREL